MESHCDKEILIPSNTNHRLEHTVKHQQGNLPQPQVRTQQQVRTQKHVAHRLEHTHTAIGQERLKLKNKIQNMWHRPEPQTVLAIQIFSGVYNFFHTQIENKHPNKHYLIILPKSFFGVTFRDLFLVSVPKSCTKA